MSFSADLEGLLLKLSNPDPLAEDGRSRALRAATIDQYRRQIVRFASELVHSGIPATDIVSVETLFAPDILERGLRQMLSRTDHQITKTISETARLFRNLGKVTGQTVDVLQHLDKFARRLSTSPQRGMTRKNRERLRVLQDERAMLRLLRLPEQLFSHPPEGKANHFTVGLCKEDAIAIAILLVCPIRIKNLADIHLEQHIQRPGDGKAYLVLTEEDTKNGRPMEFELPVEVVRMIDRHVASRCPHMCPPGTPWLFPRRDGKGPLLSSQLADRIKKRVRTATGFTVNAHLFRHLAVMNWLDAHPGAYEVARRLLGHSEVSHTINMYSGLEVKSATRAFADLIETRKGRRP
ncbi:site-specific integrase [Salipiger sp. IMCC34102]|uniref:tyrosine-type recombinase/integrase n=1 Tax=Salipiger sp. IMCC34102 TaxID=2510647 RepID=UPI00101C5399|nr:tyrosine-type recombinase/integrase [Salipiger sp. IMCC34102]RYH00903.1 site-specific integrase [Salipiger sp. IMCC34102]